MSFGLKALPRTALAGLIRIYQRTLSPLFSVYYGCGCGCRFVPSCSEYAAEAVRTHGAAKGSLLTAGRLARCMPFCPGGYDPVPPAHSAAPLRRNAPRCARAV